MHEDRNYLYNPPCGIHIALGIGAGHIQLLLSGGPEPVRVGLRSGLQWQRVVMVVDDVGGGFPRSLGQVYTAGLVRRVWLRFYKTIQHYCIMYGSTRIDRGG